MRKGYLFAMLAGAGVALAATPVEQGYHQMYNLDFDGAHRSFAQYQHERPADPLGPVSDAAAYLFGEFDRLKVLQSQFFETDEKYRALKKLDADPVVRQRFHESLDKGNKLVADILAKSPKDRDALFAQVLQTGLRADYMALIEDRNWQALGEMKNGRMQAEKLLAVDPKCYDAYVAIGVENYMLSLKPVAARFFLRLTGAQTDRTVGYEKMKLVAEGGHYLRPFARMLLAVAKLRDKDFAGARDLLSGLVREFPNNRLYAEELAKLQKK